MAVFQGARLRSGPLPAADVRAGTRAAAPTVRTAYRVRPMGLLMAAIIAATMLGLVYLTQTLGSNATSSEIRDLAATSTDLDRQLRNLSVTVEAYADPHVVTKRARKLGLRNLGDVVVLPAP